MRADQNPEQLLVNKLRCAMRLLKCLAFNTNNISLKSLEALEKQYEIFVQDFKNDKLGFKSFESYRDLVAGINLALTNDITSGQAHDRIEMFIDVDFSKSTSNLMLDKMEEEAGKFIKAKNGGASIAHIIRRTIIQCEDLFFEYEPRSAKDEIRSEITFPPEYMQACLSILSYFGEIIRSKYADVEVGISIEQIKDKVILVIDPPSGEKERIEQELSKYHLVITGRMSAESYLGDPLEVQRLKHKLEMAEMEIRHTRDLMQLQQKSFTDRIENLEATINLFREALENDRSMLINAIRDVRSLARSLDKASTSHISQLVKLLEGEQSRENREQIVDKLQAIRKNDPTTFEKVHDLLLKGAAQGAAGNYLYAILTSLAKFG